MEKIYWINTCKISITSTPSESVLSFQATSTYYVHIREVNDMFMLSYFQHQYSYNVINYKALNRRVCNAITYNLHFDDAVKRTITQYLNVMAQEMFDYQIKRKGL